MAVPKASQLFAELRVSPEGAHHVLMRGEKPLLTPAEKAYRLPTAALAEALAGEWRAQKDKIIPATMPLTQLAATAIDIVGKDRERIVTQLAAYSASELLCHRASLPLALAAQQEEAWQPLLEWCAGRFGARLKADAGVMPIVQTSEAAHALRVAVEAYDDFTLAGLSHASEVTGSLVLGLALAEHERDAAGIFEAAELDTGFQAEKWGTDPVIKARFDTIRRDLDTCERWFGLVRG